MHRSWTSIYIPNFIEAKDVLPNINHTQATERGKGRKMSFFVHAVYTPKNTVLCKFGAHLFSVFQDISHTNKKPTD